MTGRGGELAQNLPPLLLQNVMVDGHVVQHAGRYPWRQLDVLQHEDVQGLGLQPPKTWDEFFVQAPKLQAAGYIPLAFGANAQQEGWLFMALLAGIAGNDGYLAM